MMFTGFSEQTFDFLWGIRFNNNRQWFLENKQTYLDSVQNPLSELAMEVWKHMTQTNKLDVTFKVSRIYRDARYSHSGEIYRDRLWFSLRSEGEDWTATPVFFFELTPEGYTYGLGYYSAPAATMLRFRRRIDEKPEEFEKIVEGFNRQSTFELYGDLYKRSKGDKPERLALWYNRKNLGAIAECPVGRELFSAEIIKVVCDGFETLLPLYHYLWSLEENK